MRFSFLEFIILVLLLAQPSIQLKQRHRSDQKQNYLNKLISIEQTLSQYFTELKSSFQYVSQQSQLYEGYQNLQEQVLQAAIIQYRNKLIEIQNNTQIPYQMKTWACKSVTAQKKNSMESSIKQIKDQVQKLQNLQTSSNLADTCLRNQQLTFNRKMVDLQVNSLQNDLSNICQNPSGIGGSGTLTTAVKIPNLSTSDNNWIYGAYTVDTYSKKLDQLAMNGATELCPVDKPFVGTNNQCFTCSDIYDISQKICTKCKNGLALNIETHQCQVVKQNVQGPDAFKCPTDSPNWNGTKCIKCQSPGSFDSAKLICVCGQGYYYDFSQQACLLKATNNKNSYSGFVNYVGQQPKYDNTLDTCPSDTPIWDGRSCIQCSLPKYFDFTSGECKTCQGQMTFDIGQKKCVVPVKKFNSNLAQVNNYAGQAPPQDKNIQSCPAQTPFFNGQECVSCNKPNFFDFSSNSCKACSSGYTFNEVSKACTKIQQAKIYYRSNTDNGYNSKGTPSENYQGIDASNIKTCTSSNPYFNGNQCTSCSLPSYFNYDSKKCENCAAGFKFDTDKKDCVESIVNNDQLNNYLVQVTNFKGKIPKFNTAIGSCPSDKPFFNGYECITCNLPKYFNLDTSMCQSCPEKEQFFNVVSQMCEYQTQKYITDIKNANIYYNGDFASIINNIALKKKGDSSIQTCPSQNPFYNPNTGKCISCPAETPLFDIKYNRCINCRDGSYFSSQQHVCISQGVVSPTIQRMFMNSFSLI